VAMKKQNVWMKDWKNPKKDDKIEIRKRIRNKYKYK